MSDIICIQIFAILGWFILFGINVRITDSYLKQYRNSIQEERIQFCANANDKDGYCL